MYYPQFSRLGTSVALSLVPGQAGTQLDSQGFLKLVVEDIQTFMGTIFPEKRGKSDQFPWLQLLVHFE